MKSLRTCLIAVLAAFAHSQTAPMPAGADQPRQPAIADFGLVYPLSSDWVRATQMVQKRLESASSPQNFDVLLAAVYVPTSDLGPSSPFFSVIAYRQPATDCRKNLEAMIAHSQDAKEKPQGKITQFSAAGRDYFRVDTIHGHSKHREAIFCTEANGHLLIWNTGAPNDDGMDAIVGTLDSIAPTPQKIATDSTASMAPQDSGPEGTPSTAVAERPQRVRVSSGVMTGLLIKKVAAVYPEEARTGYIQGTVVLQAEIGKTGDITSLELLDGPIELAGSAVAAVRQWKYRPYLLLGQPAEVETQIRVNYQLAR